MPGDGFIPQGRFWKKSKKISSKLNERCRVLVPSFGSADRSEISKKFLIVANIQFLRGGYGRKCDYSNELVPGPVQFSKSIVWSD